MNEIHLDFTILGTVVRALCAFLSCSQPLFFSHLFSEQINDDDDGGGEIRHCMTCKNLSDKFQPCHKRFLGCRL